MRKSVTDYTFIDIILMFRFCTYFICHSRMLENNCTEVFCGLFLKHDSCKCQFNKLVNKIFTELQPVCPASVWLKSYFCLFPSHYLILHPSSYCDGVHIQTDQNYLQFSSSTCSRLMQTDLHWGIWIYTVVVSVCVVLQQGQSDKQTVVYMNFYLFISSLFCFL